MTPEDPAGRLDALQSLLRGSQCRGTTEAELQAEIQKLLLAAGYRAVREHRLTPQDRLDHYLPDEQIGIEVKTVGGPSAILRQLARYCEHPKVSGLLLVSNRLALGWVPQTLAGKPVRAAGIWWAGL